jgi:alpha-methylacyl-CoA racemase
MSGPLHGYRILELAGIGPGPFAAMVLSDLGAEVLRVDRVQAIGADAPAWDVNARGRRSAAFDLKNPDGREAFLRLVAQSDALIEGFRPGVTERLGIGPDECLAVRPELVYGRMTGWGQSGPLAQTAGRDINYLALSGTLSMMGPVDRPPVPPLTLVGDMGGGGMLLAVGILAALLETARSGQGQVVDAAMVDGATLLAGMIHGLQATDSWGDRGTNLLDGGAWFYATYETADGRYVSFGAIDDASRAGLAELLGLGQLPEPDDRSTWPETGRRVADIVRSRSRDEWIEHFEGSDVCFAPVLTPEEAVLHAHLAARGTFVEVAGVRQPAPAPRFSRTSAVVAGPPPAPGEHTDAALTDWGFSPRELVELHRSGAIGSAT